jgi:hypothetical protein
MKLKRVTSKGYGARYNEIYKYRVCKEFDLFSLTCMVLHLLNIISIKFPFLSSLSSNTDTQLSLPSTIQFNISLLFTLLQYKATSLDLYLC